MNDRLLYLPLDLASALTLKSALVESIAHARRRATLHRSLTDKARDQCRAESLEHIRDHLNGLIEYPTN